MKDSGPGRPGAGRSGRKAGPPITARPAPQTAARPLPSGGLQRPAINPLKTASLSLIFSPLKTEACNAQVLTQKNAGPDPHL